MENKILKFKEILLAPGQLEYATIVGKKRISNKYKRLTYGVKESVIGAIGEYAYSLYSGMPFDDNIYNTGDGGIDFPDGTDVKTSSYMGRDVELKVSKKYLSVKKYVLAQYNDYYFPNKVFLIGEISSSNFWNKCKIKQYNKSKTNIVSVSDLDKIYN